MTYRYPRIIFPDLVEHPLLGQFQQRDEDYIQPEGLQVLLPFSFADFSLTTGPISIKVLIPVAANSYSRIVRAHVWFEPDEFYPRGSIVSINFTEIYTASGTVGTSTYFSLCAGMHYILPLDLAIEADEGNGVIVNHRADMAVFKVPHLIQIRYYTSTFLPDETTPSPLILGALEVR